MLRRARTQPYRQLPIQSFSETDNIGDVLSILRELEMGVFRRAAQLMDAMDRDDRIRAVMDTRIGALKATPIDVKPAKDKRIARKLAEQLGGIKDEPGEWDRIFPDSVTGELNRWGNGLGLGLAEQIYTTGKDSWRPRLKIWHPQFVRWDWASYSYKVLTADGEIELPKIDECPNGDGRWVLWCPYGYQYSWLRGLLRALAPKYIMRGWTYRDWARYNELHGQGIVKAIAPRAAEEEEKDDFLANVANRGAEPAILVEQGEDGNKFDIDLVEPKGQTWDSFEHHKQALDTDIAILWLGQNLTTESPAQGGGTRALGQVQERVQRDRLKVDAGIATCYREQVLVPMTKYNEGDGSLAPRPVYRTDPEKDKLQEATALKMAGDALSSLKLASPRIDTDAIAEEQGLPMKTEEQVAAEKAVAAEEAAAAGLPPPGSPAPPPPNGARPPAPAGAEPSDQDKAPAKPRRAAAALRSPMPGSINRRTFAGLPIAIENPTGTVRVWKEDGGRTIGTTKMAHDYGYIEGVMGSDGEDLDVYLGPDESAPDVHVVHQLRAPDFKAHDEDKIMLGFPSADAARAGYVAHRNDGDRAIAGMSSMPLDRFKAKLQRRTGIGKIRASAGNQPDTVAAIMRLVDKASALRATGKKRYADRLTDNAIRLGSRTLAVDVAGLRSEVREATTLPEMLDRIVKLYGSGKMAPEKLAALVAKVRLMSKLAGMASVHKEVHAT